MGFLAYVRFCLSIIVLSSLVRNAISDPRINLGHFVCNSSLAASGDVFAKNFVSAMFNLSTLVNKDGFGTALVGDGPNAVYGLSQCFKDLTSIDCRLCFSEIRSVLPKCFPKTGGRIYLDGCFGRYENFSFFHQGMDSDDLRNCSSSKDSLQPDKFGEAVKKVIGSVSLEAMKTKRFAVGSDSSANLIVYALAQCWDSLDEKTCNSCLQAAASSIISCSPAVEARSFKAGCYMRYSTQLFWNLDTSSSHSSSSGKYRKVWIVLGSVLGGFLFLAGIAILIRKGYSKRLWNKSLKDSFGSELAAAISHSKLNFKYQELRKATNNFYMANKLGQGSYGTVYKGVLSDGREVAVKRLFLNTRQWIDQFFNEVNLVNQVRHKNLVKLIGCSVDGPESLLVYEYYFNKSLDNFMFDEKHVKILDWQKRVDIIQGVAEGLSYLHEESEIRIIHRDIKASNVLLDDKFKPKITDFGLARSFTEDQSHLSTGVVGTLCYMAPEYVVHGHLTEKADVYSFGVLVLEIVTGQRSSNGIGAAPGQSFLAKIWNHYKSNTLKKIIDRGIHEGAKDDEICYVIRVGLLCTQATRSCRPAMTKVVELLRSHTKEDLYPTDPPFLDVYLEQNHELEPLESSHLLSGASAAGFSGSSGRLDCGR